MSNPFQTIGAKLPGDLLARFQQQERQSEQRADRAIGPISEGTLIEDIAVDNTGFTKVSHKLGRKWRGFIKVDDDAGITLFAQRVDDDSLFIEVQAASGSANVTLWVF